MMYKLTDSFPYLLAHAGARMGELFSNELARDGLTLPMYRAMAALWERDGQRLSELAAMITIETSTLSRVITTLKKCGLVSRQRKVGDERSVRLCLTDRGREEVSRLIPRAQSYEALAVNGFTPDEMAHLKDVFRRILANLATHDVTTEPERRILAKRPRPRRQRMG